MGKKHASQYANFGWLLFDGVLVVLCRKSMQLKLIIQEIAWIF